MVHYECEKKEHNFSILWEYLIIFPNIGEKLFYIICRVFFQKTVILIRIHKHQSNIQSFLNRLIIYYITRILDLYLLCFNMSNLGEKLFYTIYCVLISRFQFTKTFCANKYHPLTFTFFCHTQIIYPLNKVASSKVQSLRLKGKNEIWSL